MDNLVLRKYSMAPLNMVKPSHFESIIHSVNGGETAGVCFTTNEFAAAEEAHRYLAITYTPKFENIFKLTKESVGRVELKNPFGGNEPTRVWPAFGLHGGGCEIILTEGQLWCDLANERFPNGGRPDSFHQDSTKSDKIFVDELVQIVWDWLKKRKEEVPEKENLAMKVMDGLGIVISWLGIPSYKRYAISCAYKESEKKDSVGLRFWGYVWDDKKDDLIRILSKPVITDFYINFGLEALRTRLKRDGYLKKEVGQILSEIHDCLIPIAQAFDSGGKTVPPKDRILLPPISCTEFSWSMADSRRM